MKLFHLLPFVSLVACGSAFETGNLFPDDAGDAAAEANHLDAAEGRMDAGSPEEAASETGSPTPEASPEAALEVEAGASEAAAETSPPPECLAPRCVDGKTTQSCDDGVWGAFTTCPYVCLNNACSGICTPGSTSCVSNTRLQTCDSTGQWMTGTCPDACVGTTCGGVCVPETTSTCFDACDDQGTITCTASGQWGTCSVSCGGGG